MPHSRHPESQQMPVASFSPMGYGRVDFRSTESMVHANRHHPSPLWMRAAHASPHSRSAVAIHQTRSNSSLEDHHYGQVPVMATVLSQDSTSSVSSSAKRDYNSQENPQQIAASVLMLAKGRSHSPDDRSRPLKKRKTFATQMQTPIPCHVSPVSLHADDRTHVTQYSREEDDDNDSKITNASAVVPHFPSVLHILLTSSKDGVLEWLEHGKAWRIVRWEALRRSILPQFFPQLSSMDAFLAHIAAWGFREIMEGPDVGAYSHEKFHRESPEMCREMHLREVTQVRHEQPKIIGSLPRSILRVPSLSTTCSERGDASVSTCTSRFVGSPTTPDTTTDSVNTPHGNNDNIDSWNKVEGRPVFVNYSPESMTVRPSGIMPPYSPISIQSGRGRRSFFVSNRGRPLSSHRRSLPITGRTCRDDSSCLPPSHPNAVSKENEDAEPSHNSNTISISQV